MSMELLGNEFLGEFYSEREAARARRVHLEGILTILAWIATVDAFQHWIYTHLNHTPPERKQAWTELVRRFGGEVSWEGYEEGLGYLWHRQLHIFTHPFYYIEYGIAQLGALQVWANSRKNRTKALNAYKNALALGGSRALPELFAAAGCSFEFQRKTIQPLIALIQTELDSMKTE
jgi:oligoendopeptidase F